MRRILCTIAAAMMAVSPLTINQAEAGPVRYLKNRGHDFLDIFRLRAGVPAHGKGLGAKARVTSLAQVGWVYFDGTYAGIEGRGIGIVDERRHEYGISVAYQSFNEMEPVWGNYFLRDDTPWAEARDRRILRNLPYWDDGRKRPLSVGAEVVTPILGIDVGVEPTEALDFVLGIFFIDMHRDDVREYYVVPHGEPTTLPEPDTKAPFAARQKAMDDLYTGILRREVEGGMHGIPVPAEPYGAPPRSYSVEGEMISEEEAEALLRALDQTPPTTAPNDDALYTPAGPAEVDAVDASDMEEAEATDRENEKDDDDTER